MRIAICFSGQIRSFNLVKENLKKYLLLHNDYQIDVFCHTYFKYDKTSYKNYYNDNCPMVYGGYGDLNLNDVIDTLRPVSFKFEYPHYQENSKSMYYSMYKCNELKKEYEEVNNFIYDIVVKVRYDFYLESNFIFINSDMLFGINRSGNSLEINDAVLMSNSKIMDLYCSIFKEYENEDILKAQGPELLCEKHIKKHNINIRFMYKKQFYIKRADGLTMHL